MLRFAGALRSSPEDADAAMAALSQLALGQVRSLATVGFGVGSAQLRSKRQCDTARSESQ